MAAIPDADRLQRGRIGIWARCTAPAALKELLGKLETKAAFGGDDQNGFGIV